MSARFNHVEDLYRQALRPLYEGINVSIVSITIHLVNMAVIHGVTTEYVNELLKYLGTVLLPRGNMLPRSYYEARNVIKRLGLNYKIIDCCPNGCVLYQKDKQHLDKCPVQSCGLLRYICGSTTIPPKVIF
jgi:hypothetical protein